MKPIFNIKYLRCSYNPETIVLAVDNLQIHRGKFYFVIGKSGIGKSTLIESLGLMSDTMSDETEVIYDGKYSLKSIWFKDSISEFRANNYSFIFQENNLLDNFTTGENMSFGLLLSGKNSEQSKDKILPLMMSIDLPHEIYDKKVQNLSGGQRQRVAFVRALTAPFEVMFCDEPTGNLDPVVANKLMTTLKRNIVEANKTAIIVSHSIDLAVAYADHIVVITPGDNSNGLIEPKFIYDRVGETWQNHSGQEMMDFEKFLTQQIS